MARSLPTFTPASADFPTTNMPAPGRDAQLRPYLAFDATTDESCDWTFVAPLGLTTPLTAIVHYRMTSATTGSVRVEVLLEAITPGDALDTDASSSFAATNSAGGSVPGTAGYESSISVTLTNNDGVAAGDLCRLRFRRDADGTTGTDDATGDMELLAIELQDAA